MLSAILWGGLGAASLLIGYALAGRGLSNRTIGMIMGIGAGALISAIAYELVPESSLYGWGTAVAFASGALVYFWADWLVDRRGGEDRMNIAGDQAKGSGPAIFIGTLLDAIPESIILGISLAVGGTVNIAFLAAVFISNLPEGVAGTINLEKAGRTRSEILLRWMILIAISAAFAGLGYALIQWMPAAQGRLRTGFRCRSHADHAGKCDDAGSVRTRREAVRTLHRDGIFIGGDTGNPSMTHSPIMVIDTLLEYVLDADRR